LKLISENVKIFTNHTAGKIEWVNNKAEVQFENGISKQFDKIIVTIPSNKASKICSALTDHEKKELNDVKYLGVICASVILKEQIGEYYVTNIIDKNIPFTGIINMSALVDPKEFKGKILIYLPRYLNSEDDEFLLSDDELKKKFTKTLLEMYSMMKIDDIVEDLISIGVDAITPLDPYAIDYRQYKKRYGHVLTFVGNVDIEFPLSKGTAADIEKDVREHMEVLKPGYGYIASCSHSIVNYIPHENFIAYINAMHKYGAY